MFLSERGTPITTANFRKVLDRLAAAAGSAVAIKVNPHALRHACGFYLAGKGVDSRAVALPRAPFPAIDRALHGAVRCPVQGLLTRLIPAASLAAGGRPRHERQTEGVHDFQHGPETRIAILRECLVQAIAGDSGFLRELNHAVGASDIAERCGKERRIIGRFLEAGSKIRDHVCLGLQVIGGIPSGESLFCASFGCHCVLPPVFCDGDCPLDIGILSPLVSTAAEQHADVPALRVVDAVSRSVVDPHLRDARTDRPHVTRITERQPPDADIDPRLCLAVAKAYEPRLEGFGLEDFEHPASVYHGIQLCKCIYLDSTP